MIEAQEKEDSAFSRWKRSQRSRIAMLRLLPRVSAPLSWGLLFIVLLAAMLPSALVVVTGVVVGSIPTTVANGLQSQAGRGLLIALAIAGGIFLAQQILGPLQELIVETLGRKLDGHLRVRIMRAVSSVPGLAHLEDPKHLDQISVARGIGPAQYTPGGALAGLTFQTFNYTQAILATLILAQFHWFLAFTLFGTRFFWRRRLRGEFLKQIQNQTGQAKALRRSDYFRNLALRPDAAKETRIFGLEGWVLERFTHHWLSAMTDLWAQRWTSVKFILRIIGFAWIPNFVVFGLIAEAGVSRNISLGQVTTYTMAIFVMIRMGMYGQHDAQLEYGLAALPAVLKLEETTADSRLVAGSVDPAGVPKEAIRFESIHFTYPGTEIEVLNGVDIEIKAGQALAIIGANGAGKTTLVKLLCRFYDPTAGRIRVDEFDLRDLKTSEWQERVAAIFQDFVRYDLSARENIAFGHLSSFEDQRALESAAQKSGASSVIDGLPKGWETILSREYSEGTELSGGEWQKIALARAILAASAGPAVLILDEPTANLDVRAEAEIYDRFLEITRGLTTIVISHRFSTVRKADCICVLEGGSVTESGTHDELMDRNDKYAEMFRLQASRFQEDSALPGPVGEEVTHA